jgi:UDP-N-acetylglucosamine 4,6-dehydratase
MKHASAATFTLTGKTVLVTGGTGSFGQKLTALVLHRFAPSKLIIFSRDELKQYEMHQVFAEDRYPSIRYFIGDVRDRERLYRAMDGVDIVIHAAALKQVPAAEYNPIEAVKTNVLGAANLIDAAIDRDVEKVIALSTDKAAAPINLYGATKLCSDKLFVAANHYSGRRRTRFSVVRYGNVAGSRGSVVPYFLKMRETGVVPITDPRMTRFWITLGQGAEFVLSCFARMNGGEIFVPKISSMKLADLARAIAPDCRMEVTGIRPGEKLHEVMVPEDDARHTLEYDDRYVILPEFQNWDADAYRRRNGGKPCAEGFRYGSDTNTNWLTVDQLRTMVEALSESGATSRATPEGA